MMDVYGEKNAMVTVLYNDGGYKIIKELVDRGFIVAKGKSADTLGVGNKLGICIDLKRGNYFCIDANNRFVLECTAEELIQIHPHLREEHLNMPVLEIYYPIKKVSALQYKHTQESVFDFFKHGYCIGGCDDGALIREIGGEFCLMKGDWLIDRGGGLNPTHLSDKEFKRKYDPIK